MRASQLRPCGAGRPQRLGSGTFLEAYWRRTGGGLLEAVYWRRTGGVVYWRRTGGVVYWRRSTGGGLAQCAARLLWNGRATARTTLPYGQEPWRPVARRARVTLEGQGCRDYRRRATAAGLQLPQSTRSEATLLPIRLYCTLRWPCLNRCMPSLFS